MLLPLSIISSHWFVSRSSPYVTSTRDGGAADEHPLPPPQPSAADQQHMLLANRHSVVAATPAAHSNYCAGEEQHRRYSAAIVDGVLELVCADDLVDAAFDDAFIDLRVLLLTPEWTCTRSSSPPPPPPPPAEPPAELPRRVESIDQSTPPPPTRGVESVDSPLPLSSVVKMDTVDKLSRDSSISSDRAGSQV